MEKNENSADLLLERIKKRVEHEQFLSEKDELWMLDWYLRLREKYKYDRNKLAQIIEDWGSYLWNKDMFHMTVASMGTQEIADASQDDLRKYSITQSEIENRFASLLGEEAEKWLKKKRQGEIKGMAG